VNVGMKCRLRNSIFVGALLGIPLGAAGQSAATLNAKGYLARWYGIDPARILPTTDESLHGQDVTFYLVPGSADFNHNYLDTTKTNEKPCSVKPATHLTRRH
jgi:hypothetical protein